MTHRLPDRLRLVRTVEGVTVPQEQAVRSQDAPELTLVGAKRGNNDVAGRDNFTPFAGLEGVGAAVGVLLHDVVAVHRDGPAVGRGELLAPLELLHAEAPF